MDIGEGMVAVVRGLRDSSLAVTLLDGNRKYTLMPNNAQFTNPKHVQIVRKEEHVGNCVAHREPERREVPTQCKSTTARCESGAQATDGRYASMYKTTHCRVTPTSPPVELTEFPPQRAELCRGHDNFEVGGAGSGDTYTLNRTSTNFRGGMSWTDRGSVYEPRPSPRPDAFAKSLRKYPSLSPERSTEIFERLISYSQSKSAKNNIRSQTSPSRVSEATSHRSQKTCEFESNCRTKKYESPTRDSQHRRCDSECTDFQKAVFRNYDVRYFKEVSKRTKDSFRNLPPQNTNSVNMEIQAVVEMASKEVATPPRMNPSERSVAVSLSPTTSTAKRNDEGEDRSWASYPTSLYKNAQTDIKQNKPLGQSKPVKTSSSSIHMSNQDYVCPCMCHDYRKSKSEGELRNDDLKEPAAQFQAISSISTMPKLMFSESQTFINNGDSFKLRNDFKNFQPFCKDCVNCKYNIDSYRAKVREMSITDDHLEAIISEWLKYIPIINNNFIGRHVNRQYITRIIANKLKNIYLNAENENALKSGIVTLIEEIPIDINDVNKEAYISSLADRLFSKIMEVLKLNVNKSRKNRIDRNNNKHLSAFIVLQNTTHSSRYSAKTATDFSIESINQQDIDAYLDIYTSQLSQEIRSWLSIVLGSEVNYIREVVVNDLAGDILDRLKYLEKNPAKKGSAKDELEVLKFQLFKSINKLVDEDAIQQVIERAPELMERLRIIPVPMLSRPEEHGYTHKESLPPCCVPQSTLKTKELYPDPSFKKQSAHQSPTSYNFPEQAMFNAPSHSGSGARKPVLENIYVDPGANTLDAIMGLNTGNLNLNQTPRFGVGAGGSILQPSSNIQQQHRRGSLPEANNLENISQDFGNIKLSQMPVFGPAGGGGSMIEHPGRRIYTNKRFSSPGAFASVPITRDVPNIYNNQMATFHPTAHLDGAIQGLNNQNLTNSRPPAPWSFASAPMFQNSENVNLSQTPTYTSSGPGINMSQVRESAGAIEYAVPMIRKYNVNEMPVFGAAGAGGSMIYSGRSKHGIRRMSGPGAFDLETRARGPYQPAPSSTRNPVIGTDPRQNTSRLDEPDQSVDRINIEYDQFLKDWVKELPLPTTTLEEKTVADTIRSGFYNGVWKAVLKIKLDPTKYTDPVYFQDVLDDEIQELFDLLPETQELERKKDSLKKNLLQQTVETIIMILSKSRASNYKQQLIDQVSKHLPNRVKLSSDFQTNRHEELQKMQLVDTFILYTRYKQCDKVRANVYRKKLNDCVEDIINNVKHTHKDSLENIDMQTYKNEIINALHKVPLPTADVITEEADEILLGIEIEKWFLDLPIVANNDHAEQLDRRRMRYAFVKQIHDMGKQMNLTDDSSNEQLKIAVKRLLQKLPLLPNQNINLDFMAKEFANRLRNRARENATQRPKSVSFEGPDFFADFAKHVLLSSSAAEVNSYIDDGDSRSQYYESNRDQGGRLVQIVNGYEPQPSQPQKWLSLLPVTPGLVNSELLAPFSQQSRQEVQASHQLPHLSEQAERIVVNPQQQILPENQIFTSNQVIQAPVLYTEAPEQIQRSPHGLIPIVQPVTTTEAQIIAKDQALLASSSPAQQRSKHVILTLPEVPPQIPIITKELPQKSIGSVHQPVPSRPIGILGISQTAGSSGQQPITTAPNALTNVPNIIITEPTLPNLYQKSKAASSVPLPQTQPQKVPAPNIPNERGFQHLPASHQAVTAPPTGIFYTNDDLPVAYSTPEQSEPPRDAPPKLERKKPRHPERRSNGARRRLDLEDTEESDSDEIQCRCMKRTYRCRRQRSCYDYDDYNIIECPRFFPMRYFHPYFF